MPQKSEQITTRV